MRLIFIGPPGVGKGTQAQLLAVSLKIPKISTGDILREAVEEGTALGREAKRFMDGGKLVPDEVVVGIIRDRIDAPDAKDGYILDGFPRTIPQAEALTVMLSERGEGIDRVLNFDLGDEELVRRLSGRRSCPGCKSVYHVDSAPPKKPGICDRCDASLMTRSDDEPGTVRKRLEVFRSQTTPLIAFYAKNGALHRVDGSGSVEVVRRRVEEAVRTVRS